MPTTPRFVPTTAPGQVRFAGQPEWCAARFATSFSPTGAELHIERTGSTGAEIVALRDVTALEELLGAPDGHHEVEISVRQTPALQALWPATFTPAVLDALATTVDEAPVDLTAATVVTAGRSRTPRRLTNGGIIGALALAGCGALVVGLLGLREEGPDTPVETKVLTQTTIRGPVSTSTAPTATTSTTSSGSDDCPSAEGTGSTIAPPATTTTAGPATCEPR
jgi:hypothetical protein